VRLTGCTVEIFIKGERIAVHMRSSGNGTTITDHMPSSHRRYADWTIGRIRRDAALIGPATTALCDLILEQRQQGFRSCLGILSLARPFGVARLEAAATSAIEIGAPTYRSVRSILDHKLDRHTARPRAADGAPILHSNIRGSKAFSEIEAPGEAATLSHPEWLALLLDQEASYRGDRRLDARLRYARLRHQAAEGAWIDAHENLVLCGPTGLVT
jgi:hypothetical protein